jgi:hypothetical protein
MILIKGVGYKTSNPKRKKRVPPMQRRSFKVQVQGGERSTLFSVSVERLIEVISTSKTDEIGRECGNCWLKDEPRSRCCSEEGRVSCQQIHHPQKTMCGVREEEEIPD